MKEMNEPRKLLVTHTCVCVTPLSNDRNRGKLLHEFVAIIRKCETGMERQ